MRGRGGAEEMRKSREDEERSGEVKRKGEEECRR